MREKERERERDREKEREKERQKENAGRRKTVYMKNRKERES